MLYGCDSTRHVEGQPVATEFVAVKTLAGCGHTRAAAAAATIDGSDGTSGVALSHSARVCDGFGDSGIGTGGKIVLSRTREEVVVFCTEALQECREMV
jgi:hypothetical protein